MAWDSATADNVSRRSASQSDVAPRSVNRRVLRSDDSLFTYDDSVITPVGGRALLNNAAVANTVRITGEYLFTEDNELDYSSSVTDGMAAATVTFSELPSDTVKVYVYVALRETSTYPYVTYKRSSGGTQAYILGVNFADAGTNNFIGTWWLPTSGNSIYITGVQADTLSTFIILGYQRGA